VDVEFERLDQRTTPEAAHHVLRGAILNGTLAAGRQLGEVRIATDLGISRAPLREALSRLEEEGLVVRVPFRGAFVATVDPTTIADIASVRALVEPYAAELAAKRLRSSDRGRLTDAAEALRGATTGGDIPASIDAHLLFHRLFYECSEHGILQGLWNGWESTLRLFLAADHRSFGDLEEIARAHERLLDIVLTGDVSRFGPEVALHVQPA
jgi:DNA-binding GntR family transcriptional regulator